jgi:hypothetical protein
MYGCTASWHGHFLMPQEHRDRHGIHQRRTLLCRTVAERSSRGNGTVVTVWFSAAVPGVQAAWLVMAAMSTSLRAVPGGPVPVDHAPETGRNASDRRPIPDNHLRPPEASHLSYANTQNDRRRGRDEGAVPGCQIASPDGLADLSGNLYEAVGSALPPVEHVERGALFEWSAHAAPRRSTGSHRPRGDDRSTDEVISPGAPRPQNRMPHAVDRGTRSSAKSRARRLRAGMPPCPVRASWANCRCASQNRGGRGVAHGSGCGRRSAGSANRSRSSGRKQP